MEFLSPKFEVLRMEFSGHGKNSLKEFPWSISAFAKALEEFILENNAEGCEIFGYSMGGYACTCAGASASECEKRRGEILRLRSE